MYEFETRKVELVGVTRKDGSAFEPDNWRYGYVGSWGDLTVGEVLGKPGAWRASFDNIVWPDGSKTIPPHGGFSTTHGSLERVDDLVTVSTLNAVYTWRLLSADEAAAHRDMFERWCVEYDDGFGIEEDADD